MYDYITHIYSSHSHNKSLFLCDTSLAKYMINIVKIIINIAKKYNKVVIIRILITKFLQSNIFC